MSPAWLALATWFGAGLSPRAPGTVGSVASLVLWGPMVLLDAPVGARLFAVFVVFAVGVAAAQKVVDVRGEDPQVVVIDEVAGMGIALLFPWASTWYLLVGFILFRVFDILKPWPVSWADRQVGGGFGVMLDDVIAGAYALLVFVGVVLFAGSLLPDLQGIHGMVISLPRVSP